MARPKAIPPQSYVLNGKTVTFPKDPQAGGTWIAFSDEYTICLLNGALKKHQHKPPYKQSRGKIIPDFFNFEGFLSFSETYDFQGIENFTLIVIDNKAMSIDKLVWDGEHALHNTLDHKESHMFSSVTLYSDEIITQRQLWFQEFLNRNPQFSPEDVMNFHQFGGTGDQNNDLTINRNDELKTQCIIQIVRRNQESTFTYKDLI